MRVPGHGQLVSDSSYASVHSRKARPAVVLLVVGFNLAEITTA